MSNQNREIKFSDLPKEGEFSPALKTMAIELMDKIIEFRPISIINSKLGGAPMNDIKENLFLNKYTLLSEWKNDFQNVIDNVKKLNNPQLNDICDELNLIFDSRYKKYEDFSQYHFRKAYNDILNEFYEVNNKIISSNK